MLATKRTTAPTSPVNGRGPHWVIGCVRQWASASGRASRPRIQPRLHPLPMEERQPQTVPATVIDDVATQIFIACDLLGTVGSIGRAVVPGYRYCRFFFVRANARSMLRRWTEMPNSFCTAATRFAAGSAVMVRWRNAMIFCDSL